MSKRTEGPVGLLEPEKREERRGRMKRRRRGRSEVRAEVAVGGCWGCDGSGRRRGRPPPNWWTRIPGPPFRLKTKPGPVSKRPPPVGRVSGCKRCWWKEDRTAQPLLEGRGFRLGSRSVFSPYHLPPLPVALDPLANESDLTYQMVQHQIRPFLHRRTA